MALRLEETAACPDAWKRVGETHRKTVIFVTGGLELPRSCRSALTSLDVQVHIASLSDYRAQISSKAPDLAIADFGRDVARDLPKMEALLFEEGEIPLLIVTDIESLPEMRIPVRITCDFVVRDASVEEHALRMRQLLWPGEETSSSDLVRIGALTLNLATYQVTISGEPIDLTYLEYALLSFLATHPGRTYSRDALLRRVWGFEYYGGSRTVDVHVRRIRAKLGPEYAQCLETVRGVGYLWNA